MRIYQCLLLALLVLVCMVDMNPVNAQPQQPMATAELSEIMPQPQDNTSMWWRDGFAGIIDGASWRRFVKTGHYWYLFDADSIRIPRLGPVTTPLGEIGGVDLGLTVVADGKAYTCTKGKKWTRFEGPRLIESGRFLQRTDVRGLNFVAEDGSVLNADSRFESAAWPDQLGFSLAVRPGVLPFEEGTAVGGRVRGGFGLTGKNRFDIPPADCTARSAFALSFWAFVPMDFNAGLHSPWLVCQNGNEVVDGNFGIVLSRDAVPSVAINLGGGGKNAHRFQANRRSPLRINQWNHLVLSYDNNVVKLDANGRTIVEEKIGKVRKAPPGGLAFGVRQDGLIGFNFRGLIDEVQLFDRALKKHEIGQLYRAPAKEHKAHKPLKKWTFRGDLPEVKTLRREAWKKVKLEISLRRDGSDNRTSGIWELHDGKPWNSEKWESASLRINPLTLKRLPDAPPTSVVATDKQSNQPAPVKFDTDTGWYRINLDKIKPTVKADTPHPPNDLIERVKLELANPTDQPQVVRLMFEKTTTGLRQSPGQSITGVSAMIRDAQGNPTGIPVQLSKNWHTDIEGGTYAGVWFHGVSQVRLPAKKKTELEFTVVYGHWGGVAAASHAQLSLVGYGGNHLWEQSAVGAWGESICYNPEQVFGECAVTDIRPLMVKPNSSDRKWNWTNNVGGADFFRMFDKEDERVAHAGVTSSFNKTGPCLTDVTHQGSGGRSGIRHQVTSSLSRTDDLIRATWRIRMHVSRPVDFSRFVFFQAGSDGYAYVSDEKMAAGNTDGPYREWLTKPGGDTYPGTPFECKGNDPWASLHKTLGDTQKTEKGGWATRGIVIRKWNAKLGGKTANPWIAERGNNFGPRKVSLIDVVPPPTVTRFEKGDFVNATIEFIVVPQYASEYYGPNEALRNALKSNQDTWKMVHREAVEGRLDVSVQKGVLRNLYPGVTVSAVDNIAELKVKGGLGYIPVTVADLTTHTGHILKVNGKPIDQSVHGNDFWQTDYNPVKKTWSRTYNIPSNNSQLMTISFGRRE